MKDKFDEIFHNKAAVGILANRAQRNYQEKCKLLNEAQRRIYYLALGHIFKQYNPKIIFNYANPLPSEKYGKPQRFKKLAQSHEKKELPAEFAVLDHIRNLNSHYAHVFNHCKVKKEFAEFLCEYFQLAVIIAALQAKNQSKAVNDTDLESFFNDKEAKQKDLIIDFLVINCGFVCKYNLSIAEAINSLLFITVENVFNYPLGGTESIVIEQGQYLSCLAQVFIISLFMYRGECNVILQKINFHSGKDTHVNPKDKVTHKENRQILFNALAKKLSSEDYDSQDLTNLVRFHDMIQYLTHYPTAWLDTSTKMQKELREYLHKAELDRKKVDAAEKQEKQNTQMGHKNENKETVNEVTQDENIKEPRSEAELWRAGGRNRDRFMYFACRFLAEKNYFGVNTQFKLYKYRSTDEQEVALAKLTKAEQKIELQKKYHQGRRTGFYTWQEHGEKYPDWLEIFVIQNNAVQIKIKDDNANDVYISLQRDLLIYFLEHALFTITDETKIAGAGSTLLLDYRLQVNNERDELLKNLPIGQPHLIKKILPKKLAGPSAQRVAPAIDSLKKILEDSKQDEEKYLERKEQARRDGLEEEFLKKNKGKQFKLYFITRAWKLMYFKQSYITNKQNGDGKHHTHLNLDRDEFNNFSRFIHGMEDVEHYKNKLITLLKNKNLLTQELEKLIQRSKGIDELYTATKQKFGDWLSKQSIQDKEKPELEDYPNLADPDNNIFYLNLSHFLKHLQAEKIIQNNSGQLVFQANKHKGQLISAFYFRDKITKEDKVDKDERKLFNKLHRSRLEDCYLYEIAHRYLCEATGQERTDDLFVEVEKRYSHKLKLPIYKAPDSQGNREFLFNIELTWKKIAQYVELVNFQNFQNKKRGTNFLKAIPQYLRNGYYKFTDNSRDIDKVLMQFNTHKTISYDGIFTIYKNIIRQAFELEKIFLAMELHAISKTTSISKLQWFKNNSRIEFAAYENYITKLGLTFDEIKDIRNIIAHFDVPNNNYKNFLREVEHCYVNTLIGDKANITWNDIPDVDARILALFLKVLHNDLIDHKNKEMMHEIAREQYVYNVIKRKLH